MIEGMGKMDDRVQYKTKRGKNDENVNQLLFS